MRRQKRAAKPAKRRRKMMMALGFTVGQSSSDVPVM